VTATLLDGNVLVALAVADHVHHNVVIEWFERVEERFATTPITQGTLIRLLVRSGVSTQTALTVLDAITQHPRHVFWPDDRPYDAETLRGVVGHRQVTDAYLAALTRARGSRLATLDQGLAISQDDVAELLAP
jgi:toxin-antitoxin system PIN domain toxin